MLLGCVAVANAFSGSAAMKRKQEPPWIGVDKNDFLFKRNEKFVTSLKEKGDRHERHLTDGQTDTKSW